MEHSIFSQLNWEVVPKWVSCVYNSTSNSDSLLQHETSTTSFIQRICPQEHSCILWHNESDSATSCINLKIPNPKHISQDWSAGWSNRILYLPPTRLGSCANMSQTWQICLEVSVSPKPAEKYRYPDGCITAKHSKAILIDWIGWTRSHLES